MLNRRPRRNRRTASIRESLNETHISVSQIVEPLFVHESLKNPEAIPTLPGLYRHSLETCLAHIEGSLEVGIKSFALFPAIDEGRKDTNASEAVNEAGFYFRLIQNVKKRFPETVIYTDVALDPYSSDGHDGLVKDGEILNDETLKVLAQMSLLQAQAGADYVAPSDMMDGRIGFIRKALDQNGFSKTGIMAYSAKYASAFYGPFRDALNSAPKAGDKKTYQMDPRNSREALLEGQLDFEEGADILMVKPALCYLDIISAFHQNFSIPIAAYNVSGEYAMIKTLAKQGGGHETSMMIEVLNSIRRSGASLIFTYFARDFANFQRGN